jgi:hypothetical protein
VRAKKAIKMKCTLCKTDIGNYNPAFNHIDIDDSHGADICPECIRKIIKWQQNMYAKLFPTKTAKRIIDKRNSLNTNPDLKRSR